MPKFKLLVGGHSEGRTSYKPGDIINTPHDLVKMFGKERFARVGAVDEATVEVEVTVKTPAAPLGTDVTADFAGAADAGVLVFQNKTKFFVVDAAEPDSPLHEEPLTKAKTAAYIAKMLEPAE